MRGSREITIRKSVDWLTIGLYALLVLMGLCSIYAARYNPESESSIVNFLDFSQRYSKQLLWIALAGFIALCILFTDSRFFEYFSYYIYVAMVLLLIVTLFLAFAIKGSKSWLVLGPISIQPAEFAKFSTALALAKYMSGHGFRLKGVRNFFWVGLIIFLPVVIIILQNETGTALVYLAFMIVLFREGMSGNVLFLGFWSVLLFILVIRFGDVPMDGDLGSLGMFVSYAAIIVLQYILLFWYEKGYKSFRMLFWGNVIFFALIVAINSTKWLAIKYEYAALFAIVASVVMHAVHYFKYRKSSYLLIILFLVASLGYMYSVGRGVAKDENTARIALMGLRDEPGVAFRVFRLLANEKINVDIILQSIGRDNKKDISFTVPLNDMKPAESILTENKASLGYENISIDDKVAKVSIVGAGMMSASGIAAQMFEALYHAKINIEMISTSEIKVSVLVDKKDADRAVTAIHAMFFEN